MFRFRFDGFGNSRFRMNLVVSDGEEDARVLLEVEEVRVDLLGR